MRSVSAGRSVVAMRAAAVLVWCIGAAAGCGGDVLYVDVRAAEDIGCEHTVARLTSVEVQVIRETSDGLEQVPDLGSCQSVGPTNDVADLLAPFEAAGVYASGAPSGSRTLLRFFGYSGAQMCFNLNQIACGVTCPFVRAGEIPEEGVEARFVCRSLIEREQQIFVGCSNLENLSEEARSQICGAR